MLASLPFWPTHFWTPSGTMMMMMMMMCRSWQRRGLSAARPKSRFAAYKKRSRKYAHH